MCRCSSRSSSTRRGTQGAKDETIVARLRTSEGRSEWSSGRKLIPFRARVTVDAFSGKVSYNTPLL